MSRIGKQPVTIPDGVNVQLADREITITGSKGTLKRNIIDNISVEVKENTIVVDTMVNSTKVNAFRGLTRSLINNMVLGVTEGFRKVLLIEGVGYRAAVKGNTLVLNVGYSHPVDFELPENVKASVDGNTKITLESIDKELLGLVAAKIRQVRAPEPYKGKGIRYENEHIVRKVGKAGAK